MSVPVTIGAPVHVAPASVRRAAQICPVAWLLQISVVTPLAEAMVVMSSEVPVVAMVLSAAARLARLGTYCEPNVTVAASALPEVLTR